MRSLHLARRLLARLRPDVVVSMGGYSTVAPVVAAGIRRIPVVAHEQNAYLALSHRLTVRWITTLAASLPLTNRPKVNVVTTGNPLRVDLAEMAHAGRDSLRNDALRDFGLDTGTVTILVSGGSLGARPINEAFVRFARDWEPGRAQVIHIAGRPLESETNKLWDGAGIAHVVLGFTDEMAKVYAAADFVVGRSGGSVAELTALGLPSVLVPGPWATGNHQLKNAKVLAQAGAALVVEQTPTTYFEDLRTSVEGLLADARLRKSMSDASLSLGLPDATKRLADLVVATP